MHRVLYAEIIAVDGELLEFPFNFQRYFNVCHPRFVRVN